MLKQPLLIYKSNLYLSHYVSHAAHVYNGPQFIWYHYKAPKKLKMEFQLSKVIFVY